MKQGGIIIKKLIYWIFIFLFSYTLNVKADNNIAARIGNNFYNTLEEAILAAKSNDIITLTRNISLNEGLIINKNVNINLNNYNIEAKERVFLVQGGSLNLTGNGLVKEAKPNYGAIMLKGSTDPTKEDYSTISIGSGVTLEGWSGIFINHENNTGYGILVNMNGNINALNDTSGSNGAGIYVNGNIQHQNNSPVINLNDTTNINSTGTGIYAAGYATYNINGAHINGEQSGLGIKSGVFNIIDGTITSTGEDKTPTSGNNNGINPSGVAIQIESNDGYAGNIELNIGDGTFKSENSNVIYEYTVNGNETNVKSIDIENGTFISNANKPVISVSDSFANLHSGFIEGGTYSSDPTSYLKTGVNSTKNSNNLYEVVSNINDSLEILNFNNEKNNNHLILSLVITSIIIIGIIVYISIKKY